MTDAREELYRRVAGAFVDEERANTLIDNYAAQVRAEGLNPVERLFLAFALDLATEQVASRRDEFTNADLVALESLRRMTRGGEDAAG